MAGLSSILTDRRDHLALPRRQLGVRHAGRNQNVADHRQHVLEVFGEAGALGRQLVPVDRDGQRNAAAVELFGNPIGRTRRGAAIDDARQQKRRAGQPWQVADRSRPYGDMQCDGGSLMCLLGDDDRAVVERHAAGRQPGLDRGGHLVDPARAGPTRRWQARTIRSFDWPASTSSPRLSTPLRV